MINIHFKGWFQARFATDPDIYDHPRGQNGWTFAVEGEPDFDRVVRFADPVSPRSNGPAIGVAVDRVAIDGQDVPAHPLIGTPLEILDGPKFEGHNGAIASDGQEPVFPLHLRLRKGNALLETTEWLTLTDFEDGIPAAVLRLGRGVSQMDPALLADLLGNLTTVQFRAKRKRDLTQELASATDQTQIDALRQRIGQIADDPAADGIKLGIIELRVNYITRIPHANTIFSDPDAESGLPDISNMRWSCNWLMGAWDADALSGYIDGAFIFN